MKRWTSRCFSTRPLSNHLSLNLSLVASDPELVLAHLKSRGSEESLIKEVSKIKILNQERMRFIADRERARSSINSLSKTIFTHISSGKEQEVASLKEQVEKAKRISLSVEHELPGIDTEINKILSLIPNLIDDRLYFNYCLV